MLSVSKSVQINAYVLLIRVAGNETFGFNLAWLLIELDKHPECLKRLLAEIDSSDTEDFRTINSKMPYLNAVIEEINRLHPPIASTFRTVNREISVTSRKSRYTLPPGTLVFLALGCANRSTKDWVRMLRSSCLSDGRNGKKAVHRTSPLGMGHVVV